MQHTAESPQRFPVWLRTALLLLIGVGCVLRVIEVFHHNPLDHIFSDPARHWNQARETLTPSPMSLFDPPLYQMWLSVLQKFTLQIPALLASVIAALSVATTWLWYRAARELLGDTSRRDASQGQDSSGQDSSSQDWALLGWAVFAWLPSWIGMFDFFMTETLMLPLLGASLWQTLRARRLQTTGSFVAMAVLWLACGLTRAIALPLGALACALVWWQHPLRWRAAGIAALIAATILVPLGVRNAHYTGLWQPWGNGWLTRIYAESGKRQVNVHLHRDGAQWTYGFTAPSMVQRPLEPLSQWTSVRTGTVSFDIDMERGPTDWRLALDATAVHGAQRWWLRWENLLQVMVCESWPQNNAAYLSGSAANGLRWVWAPLLCVVIGVSIALRRRLARERMPLLLPLLMAAWFVLQAVSFVAVNEGRYRLPLEGLLILQALVLVKVVLVKSGADGTTQGSERA